MAYNFKQLEDKIKEIQTWLEHEYFTIRTGRATPSVLDGVRVESYGVLSPLNQVANVTVEDARTLRILPYDAKMGKEIEKAITACNLGLSISADQKGVRVFFPELTSENRMALIKVVRDKLEHARISLRTERDKVWSDIQKQEKDGTISEDDKFRYKDEMQKHVDEGNKMLDDIAKRKEQELNG